MSQWFRLALLVEAEPGAPGLGLGLAVCSFRFPNSQESCMVLGICEAECEC